MDIGEIVGTRSVIAILLAIFGMGLVLIQRIDSRYDKLDSEIKITGARISDAEREQARQEGVNSIFERLEPMVTSVATNQLIRANTPITFVPTQEDTSPDTRSLRLAVPQIARLTAIARVIASPFRMRDTRKTARTATNNQNFTSKFLLRRPIHSIPISISRRSSSVMGLGMSASRSQRE